MRESSARPQNPLTQMRGGATCRHPVTPQPTRGDTPGGPIPTGTTTDTPSARRRLEPAAPSVHRCDSAARYALIGRARHIPQRICRTMCASTKSIPAWSTPASPTARAARSAIAVAHPARNGWSCAAAVDQRMGRGWAEGSRSGVGGPPFRRSSPRTCGAWPGSLPAGERLRGAGRADGRPPGLASPSRPGGGGNCGGGGPSGPRQPSRLFRSGLVRCGPRLLASRRPAAPARSGRPCGAGSTAPHGSGALTAPASAAPRWRGSVRWSPGCPRRGTGSAWSRRCRCPQPGRCR